MKKKYVKSSTYEQRVLSRIMDQSTPPDAVIDYLMRELLMTMDSNDVPLHEAVADMRDYHVKDLISQAASDIKSLGLVDEAGYLKESLY